MNHVKKEFIFLWAKIVDNMDTTDGDNLAAHRKLIINI
jgi:hypothetical protein